MSSPAWHLSLSWAPLDQALIKSPLQDALLWDLEPLSSQFSRCFTAHNKWTWCHEAHSLDSLNKVWETEIKTFFAQLTQPDHQRVYPGGVNGRISENLWENTKKWRAADSSDGQNKQIDRELRRDLKRAIKQLCEERVMSWAFYLGII